MKNFAKLALVAVAALFIAACNEKKDSVVPKTDNVDSLKKIIEQRENEYQDVINTINEIQTGFAQVAEAEGRLSVAKMGEGGDKVAQIKSDIVFIAEQLKRNHELIDKLQKQSREGSVATEALRNTITSLTAQLEDKNKELADLQAELSRKDVHIAELDTKIENLNTEVSSLNTTVSDLKTETQEKSKTISSQDVQLNTAWYAFGTKKELKSKNILNSGEVLKSNFDKSYFTKIDIRVDREIKLYSKSAKILTSHPSSSYTLQQDASKQYVLRITDPATFWSTSKYLVIQVK